MEILKADKSYKRKCFIIYLLLFAAGGVFIAFGLPWFKNFVASKPPEEAVAIIAKSLVVLQLLIVPFGLYFCLFAWRIFKTGQFPPPGQKVSKDTLIHRGDKAKKRAYLIFGFGVVLIAVAAISALAIPAVISELFEVK